MLLFSVIYSVNFSSCPPNKVYTGASNLSLPFKKSNSMTNKYSTISAPVFLANSPAPKALPPVAKISSTIKTFAPLGITSCWISNSSEPYYFWNSTLKVGPGNLPGFLTGTNPAFKAKAKVGPNKNPLLSNPMT